MSLRLRRASDQYPHACWEPSNDNLVVVSGHTVVGSLKMQIGGTTGDAGWQENLAVSEFKVGDLLRDYCMGEGRQLRASAAPQGPGAITVLGSLAPIASRSSSTAV